MKYFRMLLSLFLCAILVYAGTEAVDGKSASLTIYGGFKINGKDPLPGPSTTKAIKNASNQWGIKKELLKNKDIHKKMKQIYSDAWYQANLATLMWDTGDSGNMLLHYLNNKGSYYEIDFAKMNKQSSKAMKNKMNAINNAMIAAEALCSKGKTITATSTSETVGLFADDNFNWKLAINAYRTFTKFKVTRTGNHFTMSMQYHLRDYYDWNPSKNDKILLVSQNDLYQLHVYGLGRNYEVGGCEYIYHSWSKGQRIRKIEDINHK